MVKNDKIYGEKKIMGSHISMFLLINVLNAHLFHIFVVVL